MPGSLRVERMPSAAAFLEAAMPALLEREVANGLLLGLAGQAAAGGGGGTPVAYAAVVRDDAGAVVGAGLRTHDRVVVARELAPGAVAALARDAVGAFPPAEVVGAHVPAEAHDAFVAAAGGAWRTVRAEGIHELRVVVAARPTPGARRVAGAADREALVDWVAAFAHEAAGEPRPARADAARIVDARLAAGALHVWDVDGQAVASAGWSGRTPNGVRVNLVYTPPPLRGRGYAAALVASLSQHLLDEGRALVLLHTDLANPTANGVYRRIGYQKVAEARLLARG